MRVLLLGGMGYIGSTLSGYLLNHTDHKITIVDSLEFGVNKDFFYSLLNHERVQFIKSDISDLSVIYPLIRKNDVVVNLTSLTLPNSANNPDEAIMINQHMAEIIGDCCRKLDKPVVFLSTCSNYGVAKKPVTEKADLFPVSIYALSKVNAEKYLLKNVPNSTILRCATAYGLSPGRTRWDVILNDFVKTACMSGEIEIFNPNAHRPIVHVLDISKAITKIIDSKDRNVGVYNIGFNEHNFTKKQLVEMVVKELPETKIKLVDKDDSRDYTVNFDKAQNQLGLKNERDLQLVIGDMVAQCQEDMKIW
jgi:nucleoside-diphosphate-sugar epimerase